MTVTRDYRVGAYATSTGQPGLNHRIWAEDVAASMQVNPVAVLPRDRSRDGAGLTQSPDQSAGRSVDQGVQASEVTPEAFTQWAAQQPPVIPQPQGVTGLAR